MRRNRVSAGREGTFLEAEVSAGHEGEVRVQRAKRLVLALLRGEARAVPLGRGNFGQAYEVRRGGARVIVKLPVEKDIHGRAWKTEEIRRYFRQEVGVANDLETAGFRAIPASVYVEIDGVPAIVREWGQIPANATLDEYDDLVEDLARIVAAGWRVNDDLLVARRPDGSLFVADVGMWQRRKSTREAERDAWQDLWMETHKFSGDQPWAGQGASKWDRAIPSKAEIRHLQAQADALREEIRRMTDEDEAFFANIAAEDIEEQLQKAAKRRKFKEHLAASAEGYVSKAVARRGRA